MESAVEAVLSVFYFGVFWAQPILWMWLFGVRAPWLNRLGFLLPVYSAVAALTLVLPQFAGFYVVNPPFYLMAWYSALGCAFTFILMSRYGWGFTRSLAAGALAVYVGSFLWEVPYLIRNYASTGPFDWVLHSFGLLVVWALGFYVGWAKTYAVPLIALSLGVSLFCMWVNPIAAGPVAEPVWNVPLYMFNRGFASVVTFTLLRKGVLK